MDALMSHLNRLAPLYGWGDATAITPMQPGFVAHAHRLETAVHPVMVKTYDRQRAVTARMLEYAPFYLEVTAWLAQQPALANRITYPYALPHGGYLVDDGQYVSALFNFIAGVTPREIPLSLPQQLHLVTTVGLIHRMTPQVPLPAVCRQETFAVRWDQAFDQLLYHGWDALIPDVQSMLAPHRNTLVTLLTQFRELGIQLRSRDLPCVLCHTDIHGWNTIVTGDTTHLLDFEGLVLAPAEQDLFCWFGDPRWSDIFATYAQVVGGYQIDAQALLFYQLKRYLEDIYEWVAELIVPQITQADFARYAGELQRDLRGSEAMLGAAHRISTRLATE